MFEPLKPRARILIVEGDRRVRRSLSGILQASDRVEVVGCVSTATDAVDLTRERCPDAVLIDLDRPDAGSWLDSLPTVRGACPDAVIVVLSATAVLREAALRAGADAFLSKFEVAETVSEAVVAALDAESPGLVNPLSSVHQRRTAQ